MGSEVNIKKQKGTRQVISENTWKDEQKSKSLFMLQKLNEWGLETMLNTLSKIDGSAYEWSQDELGIEQNAWDKITHSEIQPIMVFAHPAIVQEDTKRFMYYRQIAMISQKSMSNIGLRINKFEEDVLDSNNYVELCKRCKAINGVMSNLVLHMDTVTLKKIIICLGMGAGMQADGSWKNKKGRSVEESIWKKIKSWAGVNDLQINIINANKFTYNDLCYKLTSDPDIGVYRGGKLIVSVEIKGGIDPAAALERGGAVQKSCTRKDAHTKICIARHSASTTQFRKLMKSNGVKLFIFEDLNNNRGNCQNEFMKMLCLDPNSTVSVSVSTQAQAGNMS